MKDQRVKKQWESMLKHMLEDYRSKNPDDKRGDRELLDSLMDQFTKKGLIRKESGKYVIGDIL